MKKVSSSPVAGAVSTRTVEYITESGKKVTENEVTVKPSKSSAVLAAGAGAAVAAVAGVAAAPVVLAAGALGLIFGPAD